MSNQSQIALKVNDAYFTSEETAGWCRERLVEFGWVGEGKVILEPCVGSGQLVRGLPGTVIGCDLIDHGFPGVVVEDYLLSGERKVDCVFTNPPFGRMGSLALKVMNKAMGDSDRVAMILPASFRKISMVDKINPWFHPVYDEVCPNLMYELPNGEVRKVMTIFQMWERKDRRRVRVKDLLHYSQYMKRVNKEDAEYAFRTQGSSAGKVLQGLDYNPASTAFLRGSEERLRSHDWTNIASFTAGIPAIGLMDVSYGLMLEDKGIDIGIYLRKGVTSTMM
tara:strand:+ start:3358 stop:4194 length:837 start_codon:yes stop_codon:yes gene_type:complete